MLAHLMKWMLSLGVVAALLLPSASYATYAINQRNLFPLQGNVTAHQRFTVADSTQAADPAVQTLDASAKYWFTAKVKVKTVAGAASTVTWTMNACTLVACGTQTLVDQKAAITLRVGTILLMGYIDEPLGFVQITQVVTGGGTMTYDIEIQTVRIGQ